MHESVASGALGETVRGAVPSWLVPVFRGITRLGNLGVVLVAFAVDFWFVDRDRGAHAIGVVLAGTALAVALKHAFAAPRPPAAVGAVRAGGPGFPSGHAMGAAIAYGVLAVDLDAGTPRARYAAATTVVALVALSRVVLGVHFVRDVLAGVAFGLAFLVVAFGLTGRDPGLAFALAVATGLLAVGVSDVGRDAVAVLGLAVGATAAWEASRGGSLPRRASERPAVVGLFAMLAAAGAVAVGADSLSAAVFALAAALGVGLVAPPAIRDRLESAGDLTGPTTARTRRARRYAHSV